MMSFDDPDEALRHIKSRARDNAFSYTRDAFARMVERFLYEEDVKRAFSNASLDGLLEDERGRTLYALHGYGMHEETLLLLCRLAKNKVLVLDVSRAPKLPGDA